MTKRRTQQRQERYFTLSSQIAQIDTAHIHDLIGPRDSGSGWGKNCTLDIGQSKVFVKRIPVTEREYACMFSTQNLYDLPTYYNYGVGSAGFGVFRELVTHIKTTNWVLSGEIALFPLMYHYRIVPFSGPRRAVDLERHRRYVEYWNSSAQIGSYMLDRAQASHELLLFLEWLPYTLRPWLMQHPQHTRRVLDDLRATIGFLRKQGIIHFDAHFSNVLTDGEHAYLTDFGLVLDKSFMLSADEALLFKQNTHYDYGEILWGLGSLMVSWYRALPEDNQQTIRARYDLPADIQPEQLLPILINNIEAIAQDRLMPLDAIYVAEIIKYREIILLVAYFFAEMHANNQKHTKFNHARLKQLLKTTRFLADPAAKDMQVA